MERSKSETLAHYLSRRWALVPLHDVTGETCSCEAGAQCRSAGKHPLVPQWQRPEHLVTTHEALAGWLTSRPGANWGLATGVLSGVWVVDYDPAHVTDPAAAGALLLALDAAGTLVHRTGSGGRHYLFALPDDFVPNNSAKRLPDGFDVRGARRGETGGGQIVLPPSVNLAGAYTVLHDAPVRPAPADVVELVRPAPPRVAWGPRYVTADEGQIGNYVGAAINGELDTLRGTATRRNDRAYAAAARVIELSNAGGLNREAVYAAWWAAAGAHPDPAVTVPDRELLGVWASAERRVGDRPADLSGVGGAPGWMGGVGVAPFAAPAAAPQLGLSGSGGGARTTPDNAGHSPDIGRTLQVSGSPGDITDTDPVAAMISRMLTPEQLDDRPNPQPLINGVLDLNTSAWLIGAAGSYKSFVALDFAAHIGRGEPWRGHAVRQGLVVYVVAEGDQGMKLRQAAWRREYGPMKDVLFLPEPVQADERRTPGAGAWSVLVEACRRLAPVLVIIDTQARVTIGLNENDNGEMSYYADQADRIKRATGACVLTVHHIGRAGANARGASSLDGAQDAEIKVEKADLMLTLSMDKQKDQAEDPPVRIRMKRVEGGADPATGRDLSSLVLDHAEAPELSIGGMPITKAEVGKRRALALFQVVADVGAGGEGMTRARIEALFRDLDEIKALSAEARRKAWERVWAFLLSRGRVMRHGSSQRFGVFAPPDGSDDGLLTMNTGGPDDMPPDGWQIYWTEIRE